MRLAIGVVGGVVAGGILAAQLSADAVMPGMLAGGVLGAVLARRPGASEKSRTETGAGHNGTEQDLDSQDWSADDGGGDGGD